MMLWARVGTAGQEVVVNPSYSTIESPLQVEEHLLSCPFDKYLNPLIFINFQTTFF